MSLIEIILQSKPYIYKSNVINALWIEGSYATGKFNSASDIDVWLDIVPLQQMQAFKDFQDAISQVTDLREVTDISFYSKQPKLAKVKMYIKGMSNDNRIELDLQEETREFVFDRLENDIIILFDKTGAIKYGN